MQAELQEAQAARDIEQARNAVLTEQVEELIISQATALNQAEEAVSARDASIEELERVLRSHRTPHEYRQALQRATELVATTAVATSVSIVAHWTAHASTDPRSLRPQIVAQWNIPSPERSSRWLTRAIWGRA